MLTVAALVALASLELFASGVTPGPGAAVGRSTALSSSPSPGIDPSATLGALVGAAGSFSALVSAGESATSAPNLQAGKPVSVDVVLGHAGTFHLGGWTPVAVTLHNAGTAISGELVIEVSEDESDTPTVLYSRQIDLPRQTRKRWSFQVRIESIGRPLRVLVSAGGRVVGEAEVSLRERFTDARLILAVSRDASLDGLNNPVSALENNGVEDNRTRVLYPRPEQLPTRWHGYDGVVALIWQGVAFERLSPTQFEALRDWLATGGVLAVVGGADYAQAQSPRLAGLLPALPVGLVAAPTVPQLHRAFGTELHAPRPFRVNRLSRVNGSVVLRAGGLPLITERRFGRGRVVYLAFDAARYPFDTWSGMTDLWWDTLSIAPREIAALEDDSRETSPLLLALRGAQGGFPSHLYLIGFLALYLGLLLVAHQLYRDVTVVHRGATALVWLVPLAFGGGAWYLFSVLLFSAAPTVVTLSNIEPLRGSGRALVRVDVGMYSPSGQLSRFEFAGAEPAFSAARERAATSTSTGGAAAIQPWRTGRAGQLFVGPQRGRAYQLHQYSGRDVIIKDIDFVLARGAGGLTVRVSNFSNSTLNAAWILLDGALHPIGPVPPDETVSASLPPRDPGNVPLPLRLEKQMLASGLSTALAEAGVALAMKQLERLAPASSSVMSREATLLALGPGPVRLAGTSSGWRHVDLGVITMQAVVPAPTIGPDGSLDDSPGADSPGADSSSDDSSRAEAIDGDTEEPTDGDSLNRPAPATSGGSGAPGG